MYNLPFASIIFSRCLFLCQKSNEEVGFQLSRQLRDIYSTTWLPVQRRIMIHGVLVSLYPACQVTGSCQRKCSNAMQCNAAMTPYLSGLCGEMWPSPPLLQRRNQSNKRREGYSVEQEYRELGCVIKLFDKRCLTFDGLHVL